MTEDRSHASHEVIAKLIEDGYIEPVDVRFAITDAVFIYNLKAIVTLELGAGPELTAARHRLQGLLGDRLRDLVERELVG